MSTKEAPAKPHKTAIIVLTVSTAILAILVIYLLVVVGSLSKEVSYLQRQGSSGLTENDVENIVESKTYDTTSKVSDIDIRVDDLEGKVEDIENYLR